MATNDHTPWGGYPTGPYAPMGGPYRPHQTPRRRGIGGGGVAMIVVTAILTPLLIIGIVIAAMFGAVGHIAGDAMGEGFRKLPESGSIPVYYTMTERPGYQDMLDHVKGVQEKYQTEWDAMDQAGDLSMLDKYRLPHTKEGATYLADYITLLDQYAIEYPKQDGTIMSTDPGELDDMIQARTSDIDQMERHFLKGEALELTYTVTNRDGTTRTVGGWNSVQLEPTWAERETAVASYHPTAQDGPTLAQQIVEKAGLTMDWNFEDGLSHCTAGRVPKNDIWAYYCSATPQFIYANTATPGWENAAFTDQAIRHEIAHHAIHMRCGSTGPAATIDNGTDRREGVTNSYAYLYLGADRQAVLDHAQESADQGYDWYAVNAFTDEAARRIHDGQCGA